MYLGWISVATVANVTDYLYLINWNGFGIAPQVWAVIMLVVASLLGSADGAHAQGQRVRCSSSFGPSSGIALKQAAEPAVAISAWVAAGLALVLAIYSIVQRRRVTA